MEEKNIYYVTDDIAYYEVNDKEGIRYFDLSNDREIADMYLFRNVNPKIREKSYVDYVPQKKVEPAKNNSTYKIVRRLGNNRMIIQEQTGRDFLLTEVLSLVVKLAFSIIFFPLNILHYATFNDRGYSKDNQKGGFY